MEQSDQIPTGSNKKRKFAIVATGLVVLIIAAAGITALTASHDKNKPATTAQKPVQPVATAVVRITDTGFEPSTLSVKPDTKVTWTNTTSTLRQVASNPYPKNNGLPTLKSEILNNAQTYSYTASTTGSFGYHDQLNPTVNGTLIVEKQ